jgi:bacillithiol biosynthesis cysteine-adding enzyme BshC
MDSNCIRQTELPGTSALFADYLYQFERVARFYEHDPHDFESFRRAAAAVNLAADRRAARVAALEEQNGASEALERPGRPGAVAVVTGQQAGLFSGPCYTVHKALTAARLARKLSEAGVPAVPVFWVATEDHDFAEVNHCWVFDAAGAPVRLELAGENHGPVGAMGVEGAPIEGLRAALADLPFGGEIAGMVAESYASGETFGSAFVTLLRQVLAPLGMLFFDPMHSASRRLAAPTLARAAGMGAELTRGLMERGKELAAAGYHAQVNVEAQSSLLFLLEGGRRIALRRNGAECMADGERFTAEALAGRAESLSPNALLRPVVEDSMMPTVAYVGGPGELAYFAQSQVLYRALGVPMPVAVPRQSATLVDARAGKLLERYGLALPDFFGGEEAVREKIAARLVPAELKRAAGETRVRVGEVLDGFEGRLAAFDATLGAAFATSRRKIEYQLAKTERKAARAALRRDERAAGEAAYLSRLLFPCRRPQERLYSIVPFLARHGLELVSRLAEDVRLDCVDHRVMVIQ